MMFINWLKKTTHSHNYKSYDFVHHGYTLSWSGSIVKNYIKVYKCKCGEIKCEDGFILYKKNNVLTDEDIKNSFPSHEVNFVYQDMGGNQFMEYYRD